MDLNFYLTINCSREIQERSFNFFVGKKKMSASKTEVKKKTKSTFLFVARIFLFGVVAFASYGAKYLFREPWYV